MGRNKYSKTEIDAIALLLRKKKTANRSQQKLIQILDDATIAAMTPPHPRSIRLEGSHERVGSVGRDPNETHPTRLLKRR